MAHNPKFNVFKITEEYLKTELHKQLFERLTVDLVGEFMINITPKIEKLVQDKVSQIVIGNVEGVRNHLKIRDELCVYLKWDEQEPELIKTCGDKQ